MEIDNIDCAIDYSGSNTFFLMQKGEKGQGEDIFSSSIQLKITCSAVGLASAFFWRQASTNEQNSGEKSSFEGDGDGSSSICNHIVKGKEMSGFGQI